MPILLMFLVVALFTVVIIWSEPITNMLIRPTATSDMLLTITPTGLDVPTGLPEEVLESPAQTNGIMIGAVVLVLIILISTVVRIIPKKKKAE